MSFVLSDHLKLSYGFNFFSQRSTIKMSHVIFSICEIWKSKSKQMTEQKLLLIHLSKESAQLTEALMYPEFGYCSCSIIDTLTHYWICVCSAVPP